MWLIGNNEIQNIIIQNMVRTGLLDSDQHANKCYCAEETSSEVHK